jgi:hypothetical protein
MTSARLVAFLLLVVQAAPRLSTQDGRIASTGPVTSGGCRPGLNWATTSESSTSRPDRYAGVSGGAGVFGGVGLLEALRGGGGKKAKARARAARLSLESFTSSVSPPGPPGSGGGAATGLPMRGEEHGGSGDHDGVWRTVRSRRGGERTPGTARRVGAQRIVIDGSNVVKEGGGRADIARLLALLPAVCRAAGCEEAAVLVIFDGWMRFELRDGARPAAHCLRSEPCSKPPPFRSIIAHWSHSIRPSRSSASARSKELEPFGVQGSRSSSPDRPLPCASPAPASRQTSV